MLFLLPDLAAGGAQRVMLTLLRHLDRARFELSLAVIDMSRANMRGDLPSDVEPIDLCCTRVRHAMPRIARLVWLRRPDVVFSTLGHLNLALALMRPLLPHRTRYVARETVVVSEIVKEYAHPIWWRLAYRACYRWFDRIVCQSRDMLEDLEENFALPRGEAVVIHNPVDVERIAELATEPLPVGAAFPTADASGRPYVHLVAAGRLVRQKGFDILIEALAHCANDRFHLTLLGEGPLRETLERLARDCGVGERVWFAGHRTNPYAYFARADAFVLSSRFEGFPNVMVEAMACGTRVVATPAPGGVDEIAASTPECIVAAEISAKSLALALDSLGPTRRLTREAVAPYSVATIVGKYAEEFEHSR